MSDGTESFRVSLYWNTMESSRNHSVSFTLHFFCSRMMSRHVRTFRISAMTTADVVKKRSPGSVRTYRMLRMSEAFWNMSTTRLTYFSLLLTSLWPMVAFFSCIDGLVLVYSSQRVVRFAKQFPARTLGGVTLFVEDDLRDTFFVGVAVVVDCLFTFSQ